MLLTNLSFIFNLQVYIRKIRISVTENFVWMSILCFQNKIFNKADFFFLNKPRSFIPFKSQYTTDIKATPVTVILAK